MIVTIIPNKSSINPLLNTKILMNPAYHLEIQNPDEQPCFDLTQISTLIEQLC